MHFSSFLEVLSTVNFFYQFESTALIATIAIPLNFTKIILSCILIFGEKKKKKKYME